MYPFGNFSFTFSYPFLSSYVSIKIITSYFLNSLPEFLISIPHPTFQNATFYIFFSFPFPSPFFLLPLPSISLPPPSLPPSLPLFSSLTSSFPFFPSSASFFYLFSLYFLYLYLLFQRLCTFYSFPSHFPPVRLVESSISLTISKILTQ